MEIQLTDFENAAFSVLIVLLTRVILVFDLNLYIPMSRVDANMQRAHSRNASAKGKFFFRRHIRPLEERDDVIGVQRTSIFLRAATGHDSAKMFSRTENGHDKPTPLLSTHLDDEQTNVDYVSELRRSAPVAPGSDEENSYEEMTMAEIMTGKGDYFPGLIPLIDEYLECVSLIFQFVFLYTWSYIFSHLTFHPGTSTVKTSRGNVSRLTWILFRDGLLEG
jgi:glutamate--cysteine ligase catalytic subunit